MSILTKDRLAVLTDRNVNARIFSDRLTEAKAEKSDIASTTVFLSHSHVDVVEVEKAVVFLRQFGVRVYIDWQDLAMPATTNAETAEKIKARIKVCRKFILLATDNAIRSKWCNWELGYGDSVRYMNHIALFPLADSSGNWSGNEYLRLYPRIEESNLFPQRFRVVKPNEDGQELGQWLEQ